MLKAYGAEVVVCPTAVAPEHPDSYYNVSRPALAASPGAWKPDQYSNPNNPRSHYETTGPEIWAADRGPDHPLRAPAWAPAARSAASAATSRSRTPTVQVIGADPAGSVYSGGTGRPYLVEGVGEDFWPETYDRDRRRPGDRGLRRRLLRHHPPAGPRGGDARRRLVRDGGVRRRARLAQELAGTPEGDDAVIVVLLPDSRSRLPDQGLQRRVAGAVRLRRPGRRGRPDRRRGAARQVRAPARPGAHPPGRDDRRGGRDPPGVRRLPDAGRPGRAADHGGRGRRARSPSAPCSTRSSPAPPASPTRSRTTCRPPLPTIGSTESARDAVAAARGRRRGPRPRGRQAGRRPDPPGPPRLPRQRLTLPGGSTVVAFAQCVSDG